MVVGVGVVMGRVRSDGGTGGVGGGGGTSEQSWAETNTRSWWFGGRY